MSILDQFFVYHPEPWKDRDWAQLSGLSLEEVWFQAADGARLFGWYVESSATNAVVLWCHGNAGNIINRLENLKLTLPVRTVGVPVRLSRLWRSQGRPSEEGLYQDALGAHDYLTRTRMIRPERIVLFGRSLGAAVAGELAAQKPAAGLILESSFPSIEAVAKFHYGGLPVHWLLGADFRLIDRLPQSLAAEADHSRRQRRHYPPRIGPAGLRGGQATQILLRHSRRRPQQYLPGRGRGLFPTMGRVCPNRPPILACAQCETSESRSSRAITRFQKN